jgi:hypothetical protein
LPLGALPPGSAVPFATAKAPDGLVPLDAAAVPIELWPDAAPETDAAEGELDACAPGAGAFTQMASPKGLYGSHRVVPPAVRAVTLWAGAVGRVAGAELLMRGGSVGIGRWILAADGATTAVLRPPATVCGAATVLVVLLSR